MRNETGRGIFLAVGLAALAGYIDAIGFLSLGGFFVSFMSGNSTRLGVALAGGAVGTVTTAAGLIAAFIVGVIAGTALSRSVRRHNRSAVLLLVGILLALAATGFGHISTMALLAAAMGAENAVFQRDGQVSIGVTYMTGALVKLGQNLVDAFTGGPRLGWLPYLLLWCGLVTGTVTGAIVIMQLGLAAIWIACIAALLLSALAAREASPPRIDGDA